MSARFAAVLSVLLLAACSEAPPPAAPAEPTAPTVEETAAAPSAPASDPVLDRIKAVQGIDACSQLTPDELAAIYDGLRFEVHQRLEPILSGYSWDSRCTYWAGVGSLDYAKDVPTHTVELFIATVVSEQTAQSHLTRRNPGGSVTGYQSEPTIGPGAYSTVNTGVASLFFTRGQATVQINVSNLEGGSDAKLAQLRAIAKAL